MNQFVMMNPSRLTETSGDDPAAMLLRSARADAAPLGAKERLRAKLGLVEGLVQQDEPPAMPKPLPQRESNQRAKRSRTIAPFIPFQNLISAPKPIATRKLGAVFVASIQVAAMVAALFIRPFPKFEPVQESSAVRNDEPQLLFFTPKKSESPSARASVSESEKSPKLRAARKEGFGSALPARSIPVRELPAWKESIVNDEHAGLFSEHPLPPVPPLAPEFVAPLPVSKSAPMVFQAGMTQPTRIAGTDPVYPMSARLRHVTGTVIVRCVITEKGAVEDCSTLKSPAFLDEAVLAAARSWRFTPITWQGRPVSVNYVFKYNFKLG